MKRAVGPLISVLMPVRNCIKDIAEAIDSIIEQTLGDWELVIIDNASTDGTDAYVRRRAALDPRIVFHRYEYGFVDTGLSAALALCRGEWIARMDAEDRVQPNRLERQLAFMLQNRDVAVVTYPARSEDAERELMRPGVLEVPSNEPFGYVIRRDGFLDVLRRGAFARRETLVQIAAYDAGSATREDTDWWHHRLELEHNGSARFDATLLPGSNGCSLHASEARGS